MTDFQIVDFMEVDFDSEFFGFDTECTKGSADVAPATILTDWAPDCFVELIDFFDTPSEHIAKPLTGFSQDGETGHCPQSLQFSPVCGSYGSSSGDSVIDNEVTREQLVDLEATDLIRELMGPTQQVPTSLPKVPMIEPQVTPAQPGGGEDDGVDATSGTVSLHREAEIDAMADYIRTVIDKSGTTRPGDMSSKLKVHEVILIILLNATHGDMRRDLRRILAFCDETGRESCSESRHFKTLDTETMGLLWQKIKGNRNASYDTFARAMRVRREKSSGYFDYLGSGKRSKKRVYRFGDKAMAEMGRIKRTLRLISEPLTVSSERSVGNRE